MRPRNRQEKREFQTPIMLSLALWDALVRLRYPVEPRLVRTSNGKVDQRRHFSKIEKWVFYNSLPPGLKSGPAVQPPRHDIEPDHSTAEPQGVMIMDGRHEAFPVLASDGASTPGAVGDSSDGTPVREAP
jgi:hypothetical protein